MGSTHRACVERMHYSFSESLKNPGWRRFVLTFLFPSFGAKQNVFALESHAKTLLLALKRKGEAYVLRFLV